MRRSLRNLRLTPHSKNKLTPFELHFGQKPNTEIRNTVAKGISNYSDWSKIIDQLKATGYDISDNPRTSMIYANRDNTAHETDNLPFLPASGRRNTGIVRGRNATPVSKYILEKNPALKHMIRLIN